MSIPLEYIKVWKFALILLILLILRGNPETPRAGEIPFIRTQSRIVGLRKRCMGRRVNGDAKYCIY